MAWILDQARTEITFAVQHLAVSIVRGRFTEFETELTLDPEAPDHAQVRARIVAASLETGNETRDADLRSSAFLDVERHPYITFESTQVVSLSPGSFWLRGNLTLRESSREVILEGWFSKPIRDASGAERVTCSLSTELDRKLFGIVGKVFVGGAVRVNIRAELTHAAEVPAAESVSERDRG